MTEDNKLTVVDATKPKRLVSDTEDKVTYLRPVEGGKGPPGSDFLTGLPEGTIFATRDARSPNDMGWVVHTWEVCQQNNATTLLFGGGGQHPEYVRVCPKEFCQRFYLLEVDKMGIANDDK